MNRILAAGLLQSAEADLPHQRIGVAEKLQQERLVVGPGLRGQLFGRRLALAVLLLRNHAISAPDPSDTVLADPRIKTLARLRELRPAGYTFDQIAWATGRDRASIRARCYVLGIVASERHEFRSRLRRECEPPRFFRASAMLSATAYFTRFAGFLLIPPS